MLAAGVSNWLLSLFGGDEETNVVGIPSYVYVVTTETEDGMDVAGVYTSIETARRHVKKRFDEEYESYISMEYNPKYFDELVEPTEATGGEAAIFASSDNFWSWRIHKAVLRDRLPF